MARHWGFTACGKWISKRRTGFSVDSNETGRELKPRLLRQILHHPPQPRIARLWIAIAVAHPAIEPKRPFVRARHVQFDFLCLPGAEISLHILMHGCAKAHSAQLLRDKIEVD